MRNDMKPFDDKRVRQAIALTLDRPAIIDDAVGRAAPTSATTARSRRVYPTTDTSVPQRAQDLDQAKQLLADAGLPDGFKTQMNVAKTVEVPQYAQLVQAAAKEIGVEINLVVQDLTTYYGDATFGNSPWLDSIMSIVDYGHRGVPNVLLGAPLLSDGTWNAAHFKNPQYDSLVAQYVAAASTSRPSRSSRARSRRCCSTRRRSSSPTSTTSSRRVGTNVAGVVTTAIGHVFLGGASITA